jgi:hypothetical protein
VLPDLAELVLLLDLDAEEKLLWKESYSAYRFFVTGDSYTNYAICAESKLGGRSFRYDPHADHILRFVFRDNKERGEIGHWLQAYFENRLPEKGQVVLFMSLGMMEFFDKQPRKDFDPMLARSLGDFLLEPELSDFVLDVLLKNSDDLIRYNCARGVVAVAKEVPGGLRQKILLRIQARLADQKANPVRDPEEREILENIVRLLNPSTKAPASPPPKP